MGPSRSQRSRPEGSYPWSDSSHSPPSTVYQRLLVPTDGSELAGSAAREAIALAAELGASITFFSALHTPTVFHYVSYADTIRENPSLIPPEEITRQFRSQAEAWLDELVELAVSRGVAADRDTAIDEHPHRAILAAAERHGCDLIVMASHGRGGLAGLVLGSVAQKVLTHSSHPVLICRQMAPGETAADSADDGPHGPAPQGQ